MFRGLNTHTHTHTHTHAHAHTHAHTHTHTVSVTHNHRISYKAFKSYSCILSKMPEENLTQARIKKQNPTKNQKTKKQQQYFTWRKAEELCDLIKHYQKIIMKIPNPCRPCESFPAKCH